MCATYLECWVVQEKALAVGNSVVYVLWLDSVKAVGKDWVENLLETELDQNWKTKTKHPI